MILNKWHPLVPKTHVRCLKQARLYVFNSLSSVSKISHVRFLAGQHNNENVFQVVGFDLSEHYERLSRGDSFKMAFTIEENTFNGLTSVQLRIKDIKFS